MRKNLLTVAIKKKKINDIIIIISINEINCAVSLQCINCDSVVDPESTRVI